MRRCLRRSAVPALLLAGPCPADEVEVVLWEAKPNDPAVPQGKVLARIGGEGSQHAQSARVGPAKERFHVDCQLAGSGCARPWRGTSPSLAGAQQQQS